MENPTINLVERYLIANGYYEEKKEFENLFLSHPNYPSLFAVTDTLDLLGIENVAARIDKAQLTNLPNSFLSFVGEKDSMAFIQMDAQQIIVELNDKKKTAYSLNSFLEIWNSIIIAIEPNTKDLKTSEQQLSNDTSITTVGITVVFFLLLLTLLNYGVSVWIVVFLLSSLFGGYMSILIVQEKLGIKNETASKICRGFNTSCDEVITSSNNEWNQWVSFSDLPLVFFLTNFLALVFQPISALYIIGLLSFGALPVLFYSIWLQKKTLKQWCVLCLVVSGIILFQSLFFLYSFNSFFAIRIEDAYYYIIALLVVASTWYFVRPLLKNHLQDQEKINELIRFKRNFQLFQFLSTPIENASGLEDLNPIAFGNKEAKFKLTLLLSPSCGHCHSAFEQAIKLVGRFPEKVSLRILFNINVDNVDNPYRVIVQHLMVLNKKRNDEVYAAISDWHIHKMAIKEWVDKWGDNFRTESIDEELRKQYHWALKNNFNYTPVIIINDKLIPSGYTIEELHYFLNDYNEVSIEENVLRFEVVE
ncbi:thioredoxin domain-containing protein [Flavobacterium sp. SUN046]|uniref:vitamin K epoxide reductase family protein n=1 Tax=Flavobacterium sp. SUN046 TaxID=3002440 RepID=UPI002DB9730D|nr:thioredoxin domain-containing protein [Flavobacterium sp. SUN046]MEC4047853.1 thioredoxin domain-containing protein [Flavobacterium sp. SUN046]